MDKDQLISGMVRFSNGSMEWCGHESERAVSSVLEIMDMLMNDAKRIASLSEDTLGAVREFRKKIMRLKEKMETDTLESELSATQILIRELSRLTHEHEEINELVQPVVEVLQFQDRITQNMQNLQNMLKVWQETRKAVEESGRFGEDERNAFGRRLFDSTTMEEEREPLRQLFDGLPEAQFQEHSADDEGVVFW